MDSSHDVPETSFISGDVPPGRCDFRNEDNVSYFHEESEECQRTSWEHTAVPPALPRLSSVTPLPEQEKPASTGANSLPQNRTSALLRSSSPSHGGTTSRRLHTEPTQGVTRAVCLPWQIFPDSVHESLSRITQLEYYTHTFIVYAIATTCLSFVGVYVDIHIVIYALIHVITLSFVAIEMTRFDLTTLKRLFRTFDFWYLSLWVLIFGISAYVAVIGGAHDPVYTAASRKCIMWLRNPTFFICAATGVVLDAAVLVPRSIKLVFLGVMTCVFVEILFTDFYRPEAAVQICFFYCTDTRKSRMAAVVQICVFMIRYIISMYLFPKDLVMLKQNVRFHQTQQQSGSIASRLITTNQDEIEMGPLSGGRISTDVAKLNSGEETDKDDEEPWWNYISPRNRLRTAPILPLGVLRFGTFLQLTPRWTLRQSINGIMLVESRFVSRLTLHRWYPTTVAVWCVWVVASAFSNEFWPSWVRWLSVGPSLIIFSSEMARVDQTLVRLLLQNFYFLYLFMTLFAYVVISIVLKSDLRDSLPSNIPAWIQLFLATTFGLFTDAMPYMSIRIRRVLISVLTLNLFRLFVTDIVVIQTTPTDDLSRICLLSCSDTARMKISLTVTQLLFFLRFVGRVMMDPHSFVMLRAGLEATVFVLPMGEVVAPATSGSISRAARSEVSSPVSSGR